MICLLITNVAKTQDVLLNGTVFFSNTSQIKDKATFMNKNIPIELKLVETYRNQNSLTMFS